MKSERQKLIKKLDTIVREQVIKRDSSICVRCGKSGNHVSHVISRRNMRLRWDLQNLKLLCLRCHLYWWHKNPLQATAWFKSMYPERYDYLMQYKEEVISFKTYELKELYERLNK